MLTLALVLGMPPATPLQDFDWEKTEPVMVLTMPTVEKRPGSPDPVPMPGYEPKPMPTMPVYRMSMESPKLKNR